MQSARSRHEHAALQHYAAEVRPHLPAAAFKLNPARLLWLPFHLGVVGLLSGYVVLEKPAWPLALVCAVVAGHSWGCLSFLAHETLHHSVTGSRLLERVVGFIGFGIYGLSPTLWMAWHNQAHHGNTGKNVADPDGFGTVRFWQRNAVVRELEKFSPGSGYKRSGLFLFIWFSLHSLLVLVFHSERNKYYERVSRRVVYAESAAMWAFWAAVFALVGPRAFFFVYVVPVMVANFLIMSYIATNHFLNPLTEVNDPFANSLSVTTPRVLEVLHMQFGYHVEHHLYPTMSGKHFPAVRDVVVKLYGARYLTMPHVQALRLLYSRPKLHGTHDTLLDPRTGQSFEVLGPGNLEMARIETDAQAAVA